MKTLKYITLFIFLLGAVMGVQAQELEQYKENGKYGFKDNKDNIVIPAKYDDADLYFEEGIAEVKLNDKYGFIDKTGKEVIALKYDYAYGFKEGFSMVRLNNKYGAVDKKGKEVIPIIYEFMEDWGSKIFGVRLESGKWGVVTPKDSESEILVPFEYTFLDYYGHGLFIATQDTLPFRNWGLFDLNNKMILPFKYSWNTPHRNCCFALNPVMQSATEKWTFSDLKGKFLTDFKYDWTGHFMGNIAPVELNRKYGFVNKKGLELCSPRYDNIVYYKDSIGLIPVNVGAVWKKKKNEDGYEWTERKGGKWGFINQQGKEVIPVKYDSVELFEDGVALVNIKGKLGMIDEKGKELAPPIYDKFNGSKSNSLPESDKYKYHIRQAIKNGKSGFLDYNTFEVIIPFDYDEINDVYGIAVVKKGKKYGYYDIIQRKEIIPVIYDAAEPFYGWGNESTKTAKVKLDGREFKISYFGNEIKE